MVIIMTLWIGNGMFLKIQDGGNLKNFENEIVQAMNYSLPKFF